MLVKWIHMNLFCNTVKLRQTSKATYATKVVSKEIIGPELEHWGMVIKQVDEGMTQLNVNPEMNKPQPSPKDNAE